MQANLIVAEELKDNLLPLKHEIAGHYNYLKNELKESDAKFMKKNPGFKDVKKNLLSDIVAVWKKAGVPQRVETKLKDIIDKYRAARKNEIHRGKKIDEKWMRELFDICRCKSIIAERPKISRKKLHCICEYENCTPEKEILLIKYQREG